MSIRERYEILTTKEYKFSLINEVNALKDDCIKENNQEYLYKCDLLVSDIYIEHDNMEEALNLLLKDIRSIDQVVFKNIYLDYLDRLIYLYINRRNYNVAIRFISQKEKIMSDNDINVLNRLYLEYSYAYGELGKFDMAEMYLQKILSTDPDDSLKSYVLSNLTKIYVDKGDIEKSKETLNKCLSCETDHEGEIYNNYLLAKIFVLENKYKEAIILYEDIFVNEEINTMTLSIMNDYLKLLNSLKHFDKALLLMNKLSLFMNAVDDLSIKKTFYHNKLDYFAGINDNNNVSVTMKDIETIDKQIYFNEQKIQSINFEEDKNEIKEKTESEAFNKIDILTSLVDIALKGDSLRDIIMDYSNKVQKIIPFDELQFILFNKVDEQEFQMSDSISCLKYKNKRVYEKDIPYEILKGSIVEMMVTKNRPIVIDYNSSSIELKDLFTNSQIDKNNVKYLNSIPCVHNGDTFAAIIYFAKEEDLTDHSNSVLLKVSTKLLESALINLFTQENCLRLEKSLNMIVKENNISLFYLNNNTMYLSDALKQLLQVRYNSISKDDYQKKIAKNDLERYLKESQNNDKYAIKYRYELNDKIVQLLEIVEPCKDANGKILYYQGTIKSLDKDSLGYALSEKDLKNKLFELKQRSNEIEFKFSVIKIKGSVDEYINVKNNFGVEPYYLNDGTFVVILENEANQRTLDKLVKNFITRSAIVRFPRDIINIDEMISIADLMLQYNKLYFTNDVYLGYIKKNNLISKIDNILSKNLQLRSLKFNTFFGSELVEIKPVIYGLDEKERIKKYLGEDLTKKCDKKMLEAFLTSHIRTKSFFDLSNEYIYKVFNEYDMDKFNNVTFVMYEYNKLTPAIFEKLKEYNKKIILDVNLIDKLDAFYFTTNLIKAIFISESIGVNEYNKVLRLANMFNLSIISYNDLHDYDKVCYYSGENNIIN